MTLFTKKPVTELRAEAAAGTLRRALGPVHLTMLGIGAVIGTGIFVLTGTAASQHAGPALALSMVLAAAACALAGLCYAEFASMIPVAGSAYTFAYATLGELIAWIIGWDLILEYALGAATVAVGWSAYAVRVLAYVGIHVPPALAAPPVTAATMGGGAAGVFNLPAFLIVLAIAALLIAGIRESAGTNTVMVLVKVTVLVLFVALGAAYVKTANWHPFVPPNAGSFGAFGWSGVLRGAGVIFFAFIGFDAVSTAAQEARNPGRDMPVGLLASLAICTILYILVSLVLTGIVPYHGLNVAAPLAVAIEATRLTWFAPVVEVSAIAGIASTILVMLLGQTRIFYSMSRDGLLPRVFAAVHPRFKTPHVATALTSLVVALTAALLPIQILGLLTSMGTLLAFVIVSLGVLVLRKAEPDLPRPFRTPWVPWVPLLAAASCLYLMIGLPWTTWERLIVWLILGLTVYFAYGRSGASRKRRDAVEFRHDELRVAVSEE